ncbi:MAG: hypothetical protein PUA68_01805 [Bacilli bacterium]|nr:hypothetical protein [Bacilli bacterium]
MTKILSKDELFKLASDILEERNIKINDIYFVDKSPEFDFGNNVLGLSNNIDSDWMNQELDEFVTNKNLKIVDGIENINITNELLNDILIFLTKHEIRHAEQNKILTETFRNYDKTYVKYLLISLMKSTNFLKMLYHDKLYFEFDANINSMSCFNSNEMKRYLAYKLLVSYTDKLGKEYIDPITANKNMFGDNLSGIPNFEVTQYVSNHNDESIESLLLGNKLDIEELDSIKKVYKNTL